MINNSWAEFVAQKLERLSKIEIIISEEFVAQKLERLSKIEIIILSNNKFCPRIIDHTSCMI